MLSKTPTSAFSYSLIPLLILLFMFSFILYALFSVWCLILVLLFIGQFPAWLFLSLFAFTYLLLSFALKLNDDDDNRTALPSHPLPSMHFSYGAWGVL